MLEYLKNERGFLHKSAFTAFFVDLGNDIVEAIFNPSRGPTASGETSFAGTDIQNLPPGPGTSPGVQVSLTSDILPIDLGGGQPVGFSLAGLGQQLVSDIGIPFLASQILPRTPAIIPVASVGPRVPIDPFGPFPDPVTGRTVGAQQTALVAPMLGGLRAARQGISALLSLAGAKIGRRITRSNAVGLVKRIGLEAAAIALGLSIAEMATVVASAPTRRARGISASDVKRTKRTLRKINSIACQLKDVVGSRSTFGRKKAVCK